MTIGEAIRLEREAKGWGQDEAGREIAMQTATLSCYAMEWLEGRVDVGDVPSIALYAMARLDMHPLKRMVEAERVEKESTLLSTDAPWRADPKGAAEAVTGRKWSDRGFLGLRDSHEYSSQWTANVGRWGWYVWSSPNDSVDAGHETGEPGIRAASTALVEAVIRGDVILPPECPGVAELEGRP